MIRKSFYLPQVGPKKLWSNSVVRNTEALFSPNLATLLTMIDAKLTVYKNLNTSIDIPHHYIKGARSSRGQYARRHSASDARARAGRPARSARSARLCPRAAARERGNARHARSDTTPVPAGQFWGISQDCVRYMYVYEVVVMWKLGMVMSENIIIFST